MGSKGILCKWQKYKMQKSPSAQGGDIIYMGQVRGVNKTAPGREIVTKQMKLEEMSGQGGTSALLNSVSL